MTTVQVSINRASSSLLADVSLQDVFLIPEGAPGALAELERRKFTAEEGVRHLEKFHYAPSNSYLSQDHVTLLNGISFPHS